MINKREYFDYLNKVNNTNLKYNLKNKRELEKKYFLINGFYPKLEFEKEQRDKGLKTYRKGYIYLIGSDYFNFVKIGFSECEEYRLKELQVGNPFKLKIIASFKGDMLDEKLLHRKYHKYKERGEWYKIEGKLKEVISNLL